jgi:hypothetical protein
MRIRDAAVVVPTQGGTGTDSPRWRSIGVFSTRIPTTYSRVVELQKSAT